MIPRRVTLSGFLCYKDSQTIDLGGSSLWMLSGSNGSGKSSVFDAVTYALFGVHRGGAQSAVELINKDRQEMNVEFEFSLDGVRYLARRTLRRTNQGPRATQQVAKWNEAGKDGKGAWEPCPDTGRAREYAKWVEENVGLSYETFTSSVLLLQGRAEKLLDSTAAGRSEVLASIVDMARYQRLHEAADGNRRQRKAQLDALRHALDSTPEVEEHELAAADELIAAAERALHEAAGRIDALTQVEAQAGVWQQAQDRLTEARLRLTTAEGLLTEQVAIERDYRRLADLTAVLPNVQTLVTARTSAEAATAAVKRLEAHRESLGGQLEALRRSLEKVRTERAAAVEDQVRLESRQHDLAELLRDLTATVTKIDVFERRLADLRALQTELAKLPGDADEEVRRCQERYDQTEVVKRNGILLKQLTEGRQKLAEAGPAIAALERTVAETQTRRDRLGASRTELTAKQAQLEKACASAAHRAAQAAALRDQARARRDEFAALDGARLCLCCGQELTPAHFADESKRRERELAEAEARLGDAVAQRDTGARALEQCKAALGEATEQFHTAHAALTDAGHDLKTTRAGRDAAAAACATAYADLDEFFRLKVAKREPADWTATRFPEPRDLEHMRAEFANRPALKQQLDKARAAQKHLGELRAQADRLRNELDRDRAGLPAEDFGRTRERFAATQGEEISLRTKLQALRQTAKRLEKEADATAQGESRVQNDVTETVGKIATEESKRRGAQESAQQARKRLPAEWQTRADELGMADFHRYKTELEALVEKDTQGRFEELQFALTGLDALRREVQTRQRDVEATPPGSRRPVAEVRAELAAARQQKVSLDTDLQKANRTRGVLEDRLARRGALDRDIRAAERDHKLHQTLAQLLGRDRLQRHLLRQAERQIVDYANGVLDRLSGGHLLLRLVGKEEGEGADRALDLEVYNRTTGGTPINVAFLSGSQRFRVAVSLALGIGQFASRSHRPIESVIIDEGFGCLDRQGRQVMIQELQNLRGHLHCILLVSHQEEFAEAFADGYQFELADGATKVTRVSR